MISKDEFDARCWRKIKEATAEMTQDKKLSPEARAMAMEMNSVLTHAEIAVSKEVTQ